MSTTVLILGPWDYFPQPSGQPASVHSRTEAQIWSGLESVHSAVHAIFNSLFRLVIHSTVQCVNVTCNIQQFIQGGGRIFKQLREKNLRMNT